MKVFTGIKTSLKVSSVILLTLIIYYFLSKKNQNVLPPNPTNCNAYLHDVKSFFKKDNVSYYDCRPLEEEDCQPSYDEYYKRADPNSVLQRSAVCDLDWPQVLFISQEELNFPLAYFIITHTDARSMELMLATIFRPHSSYCIHIDPKSAPIFIRTVQQILDCYKAKYPGSHALVSSQSVSVFWGHFSIVEAELICLKDLLSSGRHWSYALDRTGSELMLYTNKELVTNLSSTDKPEIYAKSILMPENNKNRIKHKYKFDENAHFDPDHASNAGFFSFFITNLI